MVAGQRWREEKGRSGGKRGGDATSRPALPGQPRRAGRWPCGSCAAAPPLLSAAWSPSVETLLGSRPALLSLLLVFGILSFAFGIVNPTESTPSWRGVKYVNLRGEPQCRHILVSAF